MKRYIMDWHYEREIEDPEGEWVKYEDVKKHIKPAQLTPMWDPLPMPITLTTIPKCNCSEIINLKTGHFTPNAAARNYYDSIEWICPAHGYKTALKKPK